jgi:hypothetical protein
MCQLPTSVNNGVAGNIHVVNGHLFSLYKRSHARDTAFVAQVTSDSKEPGKPTWNLRDSRNVLQVGVGESLSESRRDCIIPMASIIT